LHEMESKLPFVAIVELQSKALGFDMKLDDIQQLCKDFEANSETKIVQELQFTLRFTQLTLDLVDDVMDNWVSRLQLDQFGLYFHLNASPEKEIVAEIEFSLEKTLFLVNVPSWNTSETKLLTATSCSEKSQDISPFVTGKMTQKRSGWLDAEVSCSKIELWLAATALERLLGFADSFSTKLNQLLVERVRPLVTNDELASVGMDGKR